MPIVRRATEQTQQEWRPTPEGLWRWIVEKPQVKKSTLYDNYQVRFPLTLTDEEKDRLKEELGDPPEGVQQSWRTSYNAGLSLGYVMRDGQYKSTKLVDFLAACLGTREGKAFRAWIAGGGGPNLNEDNQPTEEQEVAAVETWLAWIEGMEVYGTVRHEPDKKDPSVIWSRFAGPLPVGSIPGLKDDPYQALARGKLRAWMAESAGDDVPWAETTKPAEKPQPRQYEDVFTDDDELPVEASA